MASTFGPRAPWVRGLPPGIQSGPRTRTPGSCTTSTRTGARPTIWRGDARKARAPEGAVPDRSGQERCLPIGGAVDSPVPHPELKPGPALYGWTFFGDTVRVPEFSAPRPGLPTQRGHHRRRPSRRRRTGCSTSWAGSQEVSPASIEDGILCYEYNLFEIQRTKIRAQQPLPPGKVNDRDRDQPS